MYGELRVTGALQRPNEIHDGALERAMAEFEADFATPEATLDLRGDEIVIDLTGAPDQVTTVQVTPDRAAPAHGIDEGVLIRRPGKVREELTAPLPVAPDGFVRFEAMTALQRRRTLVVVLCELVAS